MARENHIAEGGLQRLLDGQKAMKSIFVEKKHAKELAKAGPEEKKEIYARMAEEARRHEKMSNHKPSAKALW